MDRQNSITLQSFTNLLATGALLRHEGMWTLIEGPFTPVKNANNPGISVFWPDFYDLENQPLWQGKRTFLLSTQEFKTLCESYLQSQPLTRPQLAGTSWQEPKKEDFAVAVEAMLAKIHRGEIHKAVPAVFARNSQTVNSADLVQMILHLLNAPPSLYVYGFWQNGSGVLGATPEVLFDFSKNVLRTMALAGTAPKSDTQRTSLLQDPKEMQEHQFVVEDLEKKLSHLGTVTCRGPHILELPTLFHLKTDIEVRCDQTPDFYQLTKDLHPTPALGVAPRAVGYRWMAAYPGQEGRRGFGAPFAFFQQDRALCLVAIRSLQWDSQESMIGSGCGIVAESELEREWKELFHKRLSVKKILGLEA